MIVSIDRSTGKEIPHATHIQSLLPSLLLRPSSLTHVRLCACARLQVFEEDEWKLILIGGLLGVCIGLLQVFLINRRG